MNRAAWDFQKPWNVFLACLLLFLSVAWTFWPSLKGNFLVHDDYSYVTGNPHVNDGLSRANVLWAFWNLDDANWHPLTWLSHMLDVQLFGLNPWGHHLTGVLLHALSTVLVFLAFRRMTGAGWRSLVLAGLFGLHPLRVESVAQIAERKDVLSMMFCGLALWAYARYAEEAAKKTGKINRFFGLTLLFFALGLMSKTTLVTLPFVFLLLDYWPLKRLEQGTRLRLLLEKIPFFVLSALVSALSYIAQSRGGAMQEMTQLPLADHFENALISYVRYLGKFFWPENLCCFYPHPGHWPASRVWLAGLILACISWFVWTRRQRQPCWLVGWCWYLGTFVPLIGLVQIGSQSMADRYTYLPMIGTCLALVWGLGDLAGRWRYGPGLMAGLAVSALAACVFLTRYEIGFWKDDVSVWRRAISVTKDNYQAHDNLGAILWKNQPMEAIQEFQEAARIRPAGFASEQRAIAQQFLDQGSLDTARVHYLVYLGIDPTAEWAEVGLGYVCFKQGQTDEALTCFQKAVNEDPTDGTAQSDLGAILLAKGQINDAIVHLQKAVGYQPTNAVAQYELGVALMKENRVNDAITNFQAVLRLRPGFERARSDLDLATRLRAQMMLTQTNQPK